MAKSKHYQKKARGSARKVGRRLPRESGYNRQEPWFLGRDYASTSFQALHTLNKYNHAVESLEGFKRYTGRENELKKLVDKTKGVGEDVSDAKKNFETQLNFVSTSLRSDMDDLKRAATAHLNEVGSTLRRTSVLGSPSQTASARRNSMRRPSPTVTHSGLFRRSQDDGNIGRTNLGQTESIQSPRDVAARERRRRNFLANGGVEASPARTVSNDAGVETSASRTVSLSAGAGVERSLHDLMREHNFQPPPPDQSPGPLPFTTPLQQPSRIPRRNFF